jgi:hypothetical protein
VSGARQLDILNRAAALIRLRIGDDEVTYLVQRARGIVPEDAERVERSETGGGDPDGAAGGAGGKGPRGIARSETGDGDLDGAAGGAGGKAPRGIARSETGDGDLDGAAGGAGGKAPGINGALRAVAWRSGRFTVVAVGADATAAHWRAALR